MAWASGFTGFHSKLEWFLGTAQIHGDYHGFGGLPTGACVWEASIFHGPWRKDQCCLKKVEA